MAADDSRYFMASSLIGGRCDRAEFTRDCRARRARIEGRQRDHFRAWHGGMARLPARDSRLYLKELLIRETIVFAHRVDFTGLPPIYAAHPRSRTTAPIALSACHGEGISTYR